MRRSPARLMKGSVSSEADVCIRWPPACTRGRAAHVSPLQSTENHIQGLSAESRKMCEVRLLIAKITDVSEGVNVGQRLEPSINLFVTYSGCGVYYHWLCQDHGWQGQRIANPPRRLGWRPARTVRRGPGSSEAGAAAPSRVWRQSMCMHKRRLGVLVKCACCALWCK